MLAVFWTDHQYTVAVLSKDSEEIAFSGARIRFRRNKTGWKPCGCRQSGLQKNMFYADCADGTVVSFVLIDAKRSGQYEHFRMKPTVCIGSSEEDDVILNCEGIVPHQFVIDAEHGRIRAKEPRIPGFVNRGIRIRDCPLKPGDVIEACGLSAVYHPLFLSIAVSSDTVCTLKKYTDAMDYPIRYPRFRTLTAVPQMIGSLPEDTAEVRVPAAERYTVHEPDALLYLPLMMMPLAAAVSSVLSAFLDGRTLSAGTILFPAVMTAVNALMIPLRKVLYNRRRKAEHRREEQRITREKEQALAELSEALNTYREKTERLFLPCGLLYEAMTKKEAGYRDSRSPACGMIRIGRSSGGFHPVIREPSDPDPGSLEEIRNACAEAEKAVCPWAVNLGVYRTVRICRTELQEKMFLNILFQMTVYFSVREYAFIFAMPEEWVMKHRYIREIPHIILQDGSRAVALQSGDARRIAESLASEKRKKAVFFSADCRYGADLPYDVRIVLDTEHTEDLCRPDLEIICDSCISAARDHICRRERLFHADTEYDAGYYLRKTAESLPLKKGTGRPGSFLQELRNDGTDPLNLRKTWAENRCREEIRAVLGVDTYGDPVILDLHESKDGPHGLIAGTTGSGKSELIITLILSLCLRYSCRDVQFVLIDFKGGASVQPFAGYDPPFPHMAGILTDLDVMDTRRVIAALKEECRMRKMCFSRLHARCGKPVTDLDDYRRIRSGEDAELAYLIIVADEFAELKQSYPEFPQELVRIARTGRSLGMHLILCTQKPSGTVNDQIRSNMSFRICLKTADPQDSAEVIETKDAAFLREAGEFYLMRDKKRIRGKAYYTRTNVQDSGPHVMLSDLCGRRQIESGHADRKEMNLLEDCILRIRKAAAGDHAAMIWQKRPSGLRHEDLKEPGVFALADDYRNRRIVPLSVNGASYLQAFFTADRYAREHCVRAVICAALSAMCEEDELFVFDDLHIGFDQFKYLGGINDVLYAPEEDRIRILYEHITGVSDRMKGECRIVITDCTRFYEGSSRAAALLHDLLEHAQDYRVRICLFAVSGSSVHYRDLHLITDRYCLKTDSLNELSSILETPVKTAVTDPFSGLIKRRELQEFFFCRTENEDLTDTIRKNEALYAAKGRFRIAEMPQEVLLSMYDGHLLPLGIRKSDHRWQEADRQTCLIVCARNAEELVPLYRVMKQMHAVILTEEDNGFEESIRNERACVIFAKIRRLQTLQILQNPGNKVLLYITEGYCGHLPFADRTARLEEGEGLYVSGGKTEVIRCVR